MSGNEVKIRPDVAVSVTTKDFQWRNFHRTVTQVCTKVDICNPSGAATLKKYSETTKEIQRLIGVASAAGQRFRALGSGWSFSDVATMDGHSLNTGYLNYIIQPGPRSVITEWHPQLDSLVFVQCGVTISQLNKYLEAPERGRSLRTSGAANGQTVGGALGTGTHGSALTEGGFQRHVTSLHIVVGPGDHIILEPKERPVASDWFAAQLGAAIVRDTVAFNAALVSFGSFGVVHGMLLETRPRFLLEAQGTSMPYGAAIRHAIDTQDTSALEVPFPAETPYFLEFTINPFDLGRVVVTTMYARDCPPAHVPDYAANGELRPGLDTLGLVGQLTDMIPALTPALLGAAVGHLVSIGSYRGTWGEIFDYISHENDACSASVGVAAEDASKVIDRILELQERISAPCLISVRFVRPTGALLEMSCFPMTCAIGIDGAVSDRTMQLYKDIWRDLDSAGIKYIHHWGKYAHMTPTRIKRMHGSGNVAKWQAARAGLLGKYADMFSNPFIERAGLN